MDDDYVLWFSTESKRSVELQLDVTRFTAECTAIICYNDEVASQLLAYLETNPGSVTAVRSFDGTIAGKQCVDFRSLEHPKEKLGQQTAERMIAILNGEDGESLVMPWEASET